MKKKERNRMTNKINGERSMTHIRTPVYIILSLTKGKLKDIQGKISTLEKIEVKALVRISYLCNVFSFFKMYRNVKLLRKFIAKFII